MFRISRAATIAALLITLIGLTLASCGPAADGPNGLEDLKKPGTRIGVAIGLPEFEHLKQDYPAANVIAYSNNPLGYEDVSNGRLDAFVYARRIMELAIESGTKGVRLLDENYSSYSVAVGIPPKQSLPDLEAKVNRFISQLRADGTLESMFDRWVVRGDYDMPEIRMPEKPAFRLRVGTTGDVMPYSFYAGTKLAGYDIELAYRFASWLGAGIEFKVYDFSGLISAAASGDIDCIMSNLYVIDEGEGNIRYSVPLFDVELTCMVRDSGQSGIRSLDDLKHADIGVLTGSNIPDHVHKALPEANLLFFNSLADEVNAVLSGKTAATAVDEPVARNIIAQNGSLKTLHQVLEPLEYAFAFGKTPENLIICKQLNDYLASVRADGTLKHLQEKWFDCSDLSTVEKPDYAGLPGPNGQIDVVIIQNPPFSFTSEGAAAGYEVDLFTRFCAEKGYAVTFTDVTMDALLSAVQSGRSDAACCGITVTEERKETLLFSEPDYSGGTVLLIKNVGADPAGGNFWSSVADSFDKTFIRESRWKLFLEGIATTLAITVLSVLFGTLLGFFAFMLCRRGNPFANAVTRFCVWLVQGMPVVVLLMILYYIVFGKLAVPGAAVAVLGFTLVFGSAVFGMLKTGVGAVDRGQYEAALALGYSDRRAFFRIILPQALPHFMPAYKGEITLLIKSTAIVGYVAVQDLTKAADIVRSRTYEAFFPLIAVAVIYFILAAILTWAVNRIEIRINPRRRSRKSVLKGVRTND